MCAYLRISRMASSRKSNSTPSSRKKYICACRLIICRKRDRKKRCHRCALAMGSTNSNTTTISAYRKDAISVHTMLMVVGGRTRDT